MVALLQEQLTAFLIGPKNGNLEKEKMDLTAAAATLIGHLMAFYKQWQMVHPSSLNQFYGYSGYRLRINKAPFMI